ncbi:RBFA family protein [Megaselia abdita]
MFIILFRRISTCEAMSTSNKLRQVKILSKLVGGKVSGSKKKFYPTQENLSHEQKHFSIVKPSKQGKNTDRRVTVLNKIFMTHISDLLATGQASNEIVGKGLQILGVKVNPDFTGVNVFWIAGDDHSKFLEEELSKCSGYLRHELSQLRLIGEVPKISFIKDRNYAISSEVDRILKTIDFDKEDEDLEQFQNELNLHSNKSTKEDEIPEMRHDVLGLDHKDIMLKIHTKLKKSKLAWEMHELGLNSLSPSVDKGESKDCYKLPKESEELNKFMAKKQQKLKSDKKKWRDHTDYSRFLLEDEKDNDDIVSRNDGDYIDEGNDKDDWKK